MKIDRLQAAILNKDPDGVVDALSPWNEEQRQAAREPFNILVLALGFGKHVVQPSDLQPDHPDVVAKRKRDRIVEMSEDDSDYDYDLYYVAWLGRYGLAGVKDCQRWPAIPRHEPQSAKIMADRQPPWWSEWYESATTGEDAIGLEVWALFYERGLVKADDFGRIAERFALDLPDALESSPEAVQRVLLEIEECRDLVYDVPKDTLQLFRAGDWIPIIEWLSGQKLLDASRLLTAALDALHEPFNQAERNGCIMLAKAVKANGKTLAEHQARWAGLVADGQSSVAGFAVQQLAKIEKAGLLDTEEAIATLPNIFSHKPKTHAKTAVDMLGRIAADESLRCPAVEAITTALIHPQKDVQKAALDVLSKHLRPDDDAAIDSIRLHGPSVVATLASDVEKLLDVAERGPAKKKKPLRKGGRSKSAAVADTADTGSSVAMDNHRFKKLAEQVAPEIRQRLRISEALQAADRARIDLLTSWSIQDVRILATAEPIQPIESIEELVEVTAAAVERCECADTVDRIVSGIVRLHRDRPKSFDTMTQSLRERGCADVWDRPQRGIVGWRLGSPFVLLIGAWLGVEPDEDDFDYLTDPVQIYLAELSKRVRAGTATPLFSEATHAGGWIDPRVWVRRLKQAQADGVEVFEEDLVRSLLRLTPDGRDEALDQCESLTSPLKPIATAALGGDVKTDTASTPQVWISAIRARDPWIDVTKHISLEEKDAVPGELKMLPDVFYPADYQWSVRERTENTSVRGLIDARPTQEDRTDADAVDEAAWAQLVARLNYDEDDEDDLSDAVSEVDDAESHAGEASFLTAALHYLPCTPAPPYAYPYMATQWPVKLDWYWCLATRGLSKRVESGTSIDEAYGRFLLPLLDVDRPLTRMAARALWIATVSKDSNSRSMAVEVWIALGETDRIDVPMFVAALQEIMEGGWVKLNRISEVLAEVAAVSPLHAWAVAELLETSLVACGSFPRGVASLLELLDECCQQLGRAVSARFRQPLQGIKSGKAKTIAKSLLDRVDQLTADREAAVAAALEARLARSGRLRISRDQE